MTYKSYFCSFKLLDNVEKNFNLDNVNIYRK